ncbi:flagellar motor protein MotB [Ahniella affigens]|uniref:Flagellar motor protein MotB n=1 Tax=Ahniella affigens TaxID=2021234 RepID=A0A2P1PUL1_9GAMM|nr:OmpA family protein [Ahniella affigens]AVP98535.1 flagellar motor protein MotB [Ahniella affigens]
MFQSQRRAGLKVNGPAMALTGAGGCRRLCRACSLMLVALMMGILLGCASQSQRPDTLNDGANFDTAIDHAADDLLVQLQRLPEFQSLVQRALQTVSKVKIVVDPAVDAASGQVTAATQSLDTRLLVRAAAKFPQFDVLPKSAEALASARYILVATMTLLPNTDSRLVRYRINLSLTDQRTSLVVAQAAAMSTAAGVDTTPTPFYRDSPALTRDRAVEGQIKTSQAPVGTDADGVYLANLTVSLLIDRGVQLYAEGKYRDALQVYEVALARPDGKQGRVFNGLYLTHTQLGNADAAQQAFAQIVRLGLGTNALAIRFLFEAGSTTFLKDAKVSAPYPMWLAVLAEEIGKSEHCLNVIGHSSRTGSASFNEQLSLQRAESIQLRLQALGAVGARLQSTGMGFRDNLIGTGTDDLSDALDRRVEFKVIPCPS